MNGAMNGIAEIGDNGEVDVTQETEHPFYGESTNERSTRHAIHAIDSEKPAAEVPEDKDDDGDPEEAEIATEENKEGAGCKQQDDRVEVLVVVVDKRAGEDCPESLPLRMTGLIKEELVWDRG